MSLFSWPIRKWRRAQGRCPWCNQDLTVVTAGGGVGVLEHLSTQVHYCASYHYFEYDSLIRQPIRTHFHFEDKQGRLPGEVVEVIDALVYAVTRLVICERFQEHEQAVAYDEAMNRAIRSCERLQDKLLGS
jgi:hypothetical protein